MPQHVYEVVAAKPHASHHHGDSSSAAGAASLNRSRPSTALRLVNDSGTAAHEVEQASLRAAQLHRIIEDQRRAVAHAEGLPKHYGARYVDSTPHRRPSGAPAEAPHDSADPTNSGLPSLSAFQLQISLMMDQQRGILQRALRQATDRIDASVAKLDQRLGAVEASCARLELKVGDEIRNADAERARLMDQLETVAEERDRYLRRIVTSTTGGPISATAASPSRNATAAAASRGATMAPTPTAATTRQQQQQPVSSAAAPAPVLPLSASAFNSAANVLSPPDTTATLANQTPSQQAIDRLSRLIGRPNQNAAAGFE